MSELSPFEDKAPSPHEATKSFAGDDYERLWAICIVSAICLFANLFVPWIFWNRVPEWLFGAMFALGGVAAQIAILSVWAGMGSNPLRLRLLYTSILVGVVCASYIVGLQIPEFMNPSMPGWVAIIIFLVGIAGWAITSLVFFGVAVATRTRLAQPSSGSDKQHDNRLSIAYVIGVTTAVAFAVAILPKLMPSRNEPLPQQQWIYIGLISLQYIVFCMACLLVSTWAVLSTRRNLLYAVVLGVLVPLSIVANLWLLSLYRRFPLDGEMITAVLGFMLGFMFFVNVMLGIVRWLGYRILSAGV